MHLCLWRKWQEPYRSGIALSSAQKFDWPLIDFKCFSFFYLTSKRGHVLHYCNLLLLLLLILLLSRLLLFISSSSSSTARQPTSSPGLSNSCLQTSLSPTTPLHPLIFSSNEENSRMLSSHLSRGLPTDLLLWNFPFIRARFFQYSSTIHWDYKTGHCNPLKLINFTISDPCNNSHISCTIVIHTIIEAAVIVVC